MLKKRWTSSNVGEESVKYKVYYSPKKDNLYIIIPYKNNKYSTFIYSEELSAETTICKIHTFKFTSAIKRMETKDGWILLVDL